MQLFPAGCATFTCCTHLANRCDRPSFGQTFPFPVAPRHLGAKTLQLNVWLVDDLSEAMDEECVVSGEWSKQCGVKYMRFRFLFGLGERIFSIGYFPLTLTISSTI